MDNCEHLLEAAARLVDRLLDSCPHLSILATSREAICVEGEARWLVPPLSVPEDGSPSEELEGYESVRLFVDRAGGRDPSFSLGPQNDRAVTEICGRLEGIPLAIELAARVGTLSLEQISQRLASSLDLLTRGGRTAEPRQRTLKGTLDWSHELLSEPEKVLFRRLSVFAGGWTLATAETVASGDGVEEDEILDLLSGLVEKSLVLAEEHEGSKLRYRMLEPVKRYAREKLQDAGEAGTVECRHADFFLAMGEQARPQLRGPEDRKWLERLERERQHEGGALVGAGERGGGAGLAPCWGARNLLAHAQPLRRREEVAGGGAGRGQAGSGGGQDQGAGGALLVGPRPVGPRPRRSHSQGGHGARPRSGDRGRPRRLPQDNVGRTGVGAGRLPAGGESCSRRASRSAAGPATGS